MYNKNDLKRMFLAGMLFANTNKNPSPEETETAFEMSINAFEPAGVCTCGVKPSEHPSKQILAMHHYSFTHHGRVTGCAICEMEAQ